MHSDVWHALRAIRKSPVFALTAVLTIALGIGTNTAIFTVVRAVLLKPLAYRDPERVVQVTGGATPARFDEIRHAARSYAEVGDYLVTIEPATLVGGADPEVLNEARVSTNFLRILGVSPVAGRGFRPEEGSAGSPAVALISNALWRRRFHSDPQISGQNMKLAGGPYTIVGVLPAGFDFPFAGLDVWTTRPAESIQPLSPMLAVFARLKPGVDLAQANSELTVLNRRYAEAHPGMLDSKPESKAEVAPLKEALVSDVKTMLWMLFGAVAFVLLIACANVAGLLMARATSRTRELAVRAALGAGRGRLAALLLAESLVLAAAGGAIGVAAAQGGLRGITRLSALDLPRAGEIRLDPMVLAFAVLLSVVTGVLFGLYPSLSASRPDLAAVLRFSGQAAQNGGERRRAWLIGRGALVVGQVSLSIVLLIGAALLIKSMVYVYRVSPGFHPDHLLTMQISLPPARYDTDQKKTAFFAQLAERVERLPGVRAASATLTLPFMGFAMTPVQLADRPPLPLNERPLGIIQNVSPSYFRTLGIPLRRGRAFSPRDSLAAPAAAMINESLARRLWPGYPAGPDPVGSRILIGASKEPVVVVGIAGDIHQSLELSPRPGMFRPCAQAPLTTAMFAVRTEGDPLRLTNAVRAEVRAIDRDQAVSAVKTIDDLMEEDQGQRRAILFLLGSFAGAALLLTIVGMYGTIAYTVAQRTQEIGIRCALGAQKRDILRLVMGQGLALTAGGIVLGTGGALALTRLLESQLFQVRATDPATYAEAGLLLVLVTLAACYFPARRAARLDPTAALRV